MITATQKKPAVLVEIERLGFKYRDEAQFDLGTLSPERRVQVRDARNYAPKDEVERYAIQMAHYQFPPIIVTSDDDPWLVDGNTRVGGALKRDQRFFPAIVLEANYKDASKKVQRELLALGATLNRQNGRPLTHREARVMASTLIELGWTTDQIGRALGIKDAAVKMVKQEIEAVNRLTRVGIANGSPSAASLRALGNKPVQALNDGPYKDLAHLALDADLNSKEITSLAKEAKATGSDKDALDKIQEFRREMGGRIRQKELTGIGQRPLARQLRERLGFVLKYAGQETSLVETQKEVTDKHVEVLKAAIAVLQATLESQTT